MSANPPSQNFLKMIQLFHFLFNHYEIFGDQVSFTNKKAIAIFFHYPQPSFTLSLKKNEHGPIVSFFDDLWLTKASNLSDVRHLFANNRIVTGLTVFNVGYGNRRFCL